ncbi:subtilisin [Cordyceps javanica]|uniref:Subtilisin n=1 Tax=Cordyceps javanica TaxID=43265 RepID=A0A545UKN3_9HYPO|nr:subtilisin [Cordyceps javanica]
MKFSSLSAVMWLAVAIAPSTLALRNGTAVGGVDNADGASTEMPGGFIVACNNVDDIEPLVQEVREHGGIVRHKFLSDIFPGFSVVMSNSSVTKEKLAQSKGAKDVWAVKMSTSGLAPSNETQAAGETGTGSEVKDPRGMKRPPYRRRQALEKNVTAPWTHVLTQVDRLHTKGFRGSGITIAVVDTGVDYKHPALGGCFGNGCRVAIGANFLPDQSADDPMDCQGHGTQVAGVLAGFSSRDNFVGAAPNATIAAYRVLGCHQEGTEDDMIAGWLRAYEDGAKIIVSSSGFQGESWAQRPLALVASKIVAMGVPCVVGLGNIRQGGFFNSMNPSTGRGVTAVNSFAQKYADGGGFVDGEAVIARLSAAGPTWDLDIKPSVGAPGHYVPVTAKNGRYGEGAGTSFAGPLVAGILALMAEVRGTFDPDLLNGLLSSTAAPQNNENALVTVAQQGGGLVRAWDAAHATTIIEPSGLAFNDTENRVPSIDMRITNAGKVAIDYVLSSTAATTLYAVEMRLGKPLLGAPFGEIFAPEAIPQAVAAINISRTALRLSPGQSATVRVTAADPDALALDLNRLPIWSGFVRISGSDGKNATVPYLGVAGSLRSADIFQHSALAVTRGPSNDDASTLIVPAPVSEAKLNSTNVTRLGPLDEIKLGIAGAIGLGSAQLRADIVPLDICPAGLSGCLSTSRLVEANGIQSLGQVPGYPKHFISREVEARVVPVPDPWDGSFAPGQYVPPGKYKIVLQALALLGNVSSAKDWQKLESPVITVTHNPSPAVSGQPFQQVLDDIFGLPPGESGPESDLSPTASREPSQEEIEAIFGTPPANGAHESAPSETGPPSDQITCTRFSGNIEVEEPAQRQAKENAVAEFEKWLANRPPGYIVFSDGSKIDADTAGYGFAVFHHRQLLDWGSAQLGRREVFDAEMHGALAGLKAAIQCNSRCEPITVCIDNTSVIDCIGLTAADSSQACFREFQKIGDKHPYLVSVKWSPGHTGIFGNSCF